MQSAFLHLFLCFLVGTANSRFVNSPSELKPEYDFIVVGGGTAGNVVAARLSEISKYSVLVIEAGGSDEGNVALEIPYAAPNAMSNTSIIWDYSTVPQAGLSQRSIAYPRGRVLGGSSAINFLAYTRGSRDDFDRMASYTGDNGWSWNNMLPYFKKSEGFTRPVDGHSTSGQIDSNAHGFNGPLKTTVYACPAPIDPMLISTTKASPSQFPFNVDYNSGNTIGMGYIQSTAGNGVRSSSATAFIHPNINRPNLDVILNTHVTKLINVAGFFKTPDLRKVEFAQSRGGQRYTVRAKKEVILSAGAINTPQILHLSGVGSPLSLLKLKIVPTIISPFVGQDLQDHVLLGSQWYVNSTDTLDVITTNETAANNILTQWVTSKTGRYANVSGNIFAWLRASASLFSFFTPDPSAGPTSAHFELYPVNQFASYAVPAPTTGNFISVVKGVMSPASRGSVTLNSNDPFEPPLIDTGFLTNPIDIQIMIEAIKTAKEMFTLSPWKGYTLQPYGELGSAKTDSDLMKYIRSQATTFYHPSSTVKAGRSYDITAPLDSELNLKGAVGVRVVDASIFPYIPAAHIQAAVFAIAERGADLIKQTW
ncbi:hypothetical protein D9613_011346 [Agrocybe pediades]|uniref:pyranose dehydrogenase (acceptor) n=1 Tax=Agrocybe pediades TaxID=84607 RepID=A0A8H4QT74_9AGAR|nr:hypothetical protein D9613_011346 [Agrocybe pediades]